MKTIKLSEEVIELLNRPYIQDALKALQNGEEVTLKAPNSKMQRFKPVYKDDYVSITSSGEVEVTHWDNDNIDKDIFNHFNIFETKQQAEQVAKWQRQFNAVALACILVNKRYDFDNNKKYVFYKAHKIWYAKLVDRLCYEGEPCVSTAEQAEQAIKLLEQWGV